MLQYPRQECRPHYREQTPCDINSIADPSSRAVQGVGLRTLACCDRGFESHRGHGCLSVVSVVCCQVEVSERD